MTQPLQKPTRNQTMECCKLLSASLIIVTHFPFPGAFGDALCYLSRFAVPTFFCISGYFNFQATRAQVSRRLVHIVKLTVLAFCLCLGWGLFSEGAFSPGAVVGFLNRGAKALLGMLLIQDPPYRFTYHLWYLLSMIVCYGALWVYTCFTGERKKDYTRLYIGAFALFAVYTALAYLLPLANAPVPSQAYRNGWLTGIPMFTMGIFLREYQERIWENFGLTAKKLGAVFLLGFVFSFLDWKAGLRSEIPVGSMVQVPTLVLLMARYPGVPIRKPWFQGLVRKLGTLSTAMYVLHMILEDIYGRYLRGAVAKLTGSGEPWLRPVLLVVLSFLAALVWERAGELIRQKNGKK